VFDYPDCVATFTLNYCNDYQDHWSVEFQGDKGTLLIDDGGFSVYDEPWKGHREPAYKVDLRLKNEPHVQNFLDCVKSRQEPNAPVEVGASAVAAPHLANIAYRKGGPAKFSPDGTRVS
jgi:predicted dehydrogenase